jgi:hypothetical protein
MNMARLAALLLLIVPAPLFAQVKVTRILDTPETRVVQVEIPANDTRPLHNHPEALWHVFVTTDAPMDLLIEGEATVQLGPWQAHFFKGGTMHGFHNPNDRTVRWVEFFALKSAGAVAMDENAAREVALALAISNREPQTGK